MFERFSERARQVIVLAQAEAKDEEGQDRIHTGHLLLGIMREEEGIGSRALVDVGVVTVDVLREEVRASAIVERVNPEPLMRSETNKQPPFTDLARRALELALREALSLGHNYIGTEHLLLGVVRAYDGVSAGVLSARGIDFEQVRTAVMDLLIGEHRERLRGERPLPKVEPSPGAPDPERIAEVAREAIVAGGRLASALVSAVGSIYAAEQLGRDQIRRVVVDTIVKSSRGTDESKADWAERIADEVCELL